MTQGMSEEDTKNLISWLQAILKETQESKAAAAEARDKITHLSAMKDHIAQAGQNSNDSERKIDETRSSLESRLNHVDNALADIKGALNDIRNKIDHLK